MILVLCAKNEWKKQNGKNHNNLMNTMKNFFAASPLESRRRRLGVYVEWNEIYLAEKKYVLRKMKIIIVIKCYYENKTN